MKVTNKNFEYKSFSPKIAIKGNILSFNYRSEDIHDKNPLILVLEREKNTIMGLNLHYNSKILEILAKEKLKEMEIYRASNFKQQPQSNKLSLTIPNIADLNKNKEPLIIYPPSLKEVFSKPTVYDKEIIRRYTYSKMFQVYKLFFII